MKHSIGDIVFLKTDKEQNPRIITGILIRPYGNLYYLSKCDTETQHFDIEFSEKINEIFKLL